jgi:hypothetical protein
MSTVSHAPRKPRIADRPHLIVASPGMRLGNKLGYALRDSGPVVGRGPTRESSLAASRQMLLGGAGELGEDARRGKGAGRDYL